jgi:hypothetical protein
MLLVWRSNIMAHIITVMLQRRRLRWLAYGVLDGSGDLKAMDLPSSRRGVQAVAEITSALEVKT